MFSIASTSGLAVGVPGTLAAVDDALRNWGTISLSESLQPAIRAAEDGFRINRFLAANIVGDGGRTSFQSETAAIFRPGGVALAEGDLLKQPDLAKTFRLIAAQGYGFGGPNTLHVMTEAMRLAFADRAVWMGDEDFVPVPKVGLLNKDYVGGRSALINPGARMAPPCRQPAAVRCGDDRRQENQPGHKQGGR